MVKLQKFIEKAIVELTNSGITVNLVNEEVVGLNRSDKEKCEGFFSDDTKKILSVATKHPFKKWSLVFLHEYCHVQQYIKKTKRWLALDLPNNSTADVEISQWLCGKKLRRRDVKKYIRIIQRMELECEKMVVRLIKKNKLEVDIDEYIRGANSYVLFYNVFLNKKKWYKRPPDISKKIKELMPNKFIKNISRITKEFEDVVIQECY